MEARSSGIRGVMQKPAPSCDTGKTQLHCTGLVLSQYLPK